jgi:metal transporter CNNM
MSDTLTWLGIAFCVTQSATFSGLNLGVFSLSRLRLEAAAESGDADAVRVLALRRDANFTLVTILWGNVAINVLLTLLADSVLAGVAAFLFSTVVITVVGEIVPQAYFSRHALPMAARFAPLLRLYQVLLWPVARPAGRLLDLWVGPEGIPWFREAELRDVLRHHARSADTEVGHLEATGAINFLALDDLPVGSEGERLDPRSILALPVGDGLPVFPRFERSPSDPFLRRLDASGKKWVVVTDEAGEPRCALDAPGFLRGTLLRGEAFDPAVACHRPLVVRDPARPIGRVLPLLTVHPERTGDDVIDEDVILLWTPDEKRIITGADLLGRLLRGIAHNPETPGAGPAGRRSAARRNVEVGR